MAARALPASRRRARLAGSKVVSAFSTHQPTPGPPRPASLPPRLTRSVEDRVVAGVAAGLAERFGIDVVAVRVAFVVLALAGGSGVVLYLLAWLMVPRRDASASIAAAAVRRPADAGHLVALGLLVAGGLLLVRELGLWFADALVWPVALAAAGLALLWREQQQDLAASGRGGAPGPPRPLALAGRQAGLRVAVGVLLVAGGIGAFLAANLDLAAATEVVLAAGVAAAGMALIFGPWAMRLARQLGEERRERIRTEERAELAAHVHDSVLQTLALIQRTDDPATAARLARRQERELRSWLYGERAGAATAGGTERLRALLEAAAAEVEDDYGVTVEVVVVGDRPGDEAAHALVLAAREAMVNAAKFSGEPSIALFAEVEHDAVSVFVRDRGVGFDPAVVPAGRRGLADSVEGRMARLGGRAVVRSAPGEGTEIELWLPGGGA